MPPARQRNQSADADADRFDFLARSIVSEGAKDEWIDEIAKIIRDYAYAIPTFGLLLGAEPGDLVTPAFERAMENMDKIGTADRPWNYFIKMLSRLAHDHRRRRIRIRSRELPVQPNLDPPCAEPLPWVVAHREERMAQIKRLLDAYPNHARDVACFKQRYFDGLAINGIAARCRATPNAVGKRVHRVLHYLRAGLNKNDASQTR